MTQLIDYYDEEKWGDLTGSRSLFQREKKALKLIAQLSKKPKKVLDVGCGDGYFLMHLEKVLGKKSELHGVDYSPYKIRKAKQLPFKFKQANIEEVGLPYEEATFDLVYAAELIEHLVNPDYFIEECRRVLKPGGYLVISTPNSHAWYNRVLFFLGIQPIFYELSTKSPLIGAGLLRGIKKGTVPVGHIRIFNTRALKDLLNAEGFRVLKFTGANFASLPQPALAIDNALSGYSKLASNMICIAQK